MRFTVALLLSTLLSETTVSAFAVPGSDVARHRPIARSDRDSSDFFHDLWKRKGGGGGGSKGGGSSSGGSSSGGTSSGGGSTSGGGSSTTGGGSTSGSGGRGSSGSGTGGQTKSGSGPQPSYGGSGAYYGGGARVPYRSGGRSPAGITPFFIGAGLGLAFWPGLWLHGAYFYPYTHPYSFHNASSGQNETKPVTCACDPEVECGCDDDGNTEVLDDLVGNGSYVDLDQTMVTVAEVNGTQRILINGTLPNGTTAPGGTEDANAGSGMRFLLENVGWWPVVVTACATVFMV